MSLRDFYRNERKFNLKEKAGRDLIFFEVLDLATERMSLSALS